MELQEGAIIAYNHNELISVKITKKKVIKVDIQDPWLRYDSVDECNLDYVKYILLQTKPTFVKY